MPIYEYNCKNCGYVFEMFFKRTAKKHENILICPECNELAKRIISKNTFHLKGDGWFNKPKKEKEVKNVLQ